MMLEVGTHSFHGLPISEQQWKFLKTIDLFIQINGWMPSYGELINLQVASKSSCQRWLPFFEDQGYIKRATGFRNGVVTDKGKQLIYEGEMLHRRWEAYRTAVLATKDKYV